MSAKCTHIKRMSSGPVTILIAGIFWGVAVLVSLPASATQIMTYGFGQNDCSGFFGQGFGSCQIMDHPDYGTTTQISPVIIKFNQSLGVEEINSSIFQTVDGSEWSFSNLANSNGTGTWTYVPDDEWTSGDYNPATADPGVKYWAAKAGNDFKLFWEVPDSAADAGGACEGLNPFSIACLNEALAVTTGTWETPLDKHSKPRALSHLTFYDSEPAYHPPTPPVPPADIPTPIPFVLLVPGLIPLGWLTYRSRVKGKRDH